MKGESIQIGYIWRLCRQMASRLSKLKYSSGWMCIFSKLKSIVWLRWNAETASVMFPIPVEEFLNPLGCRPSHFASLFFFLFDGVSWSPFCRFQNALSFPLRYFNCFATSRLFAPLSKLLPLFAFNAFAIFFLALFLGFFSIMALKRAILCAIFRIQIF